MKKHTGEKPHECDMCKERFIAHCDLARHRRTHTGERPYKCKLCDKYYTDSQFNLIRHMRRHTGEKPYKCGVCEKSFAHLASISNHMKIHANEKGGKCDMHDKVSNKIEVCVLSKDPTRQDCCIATSVTNDFTNMDHQ